MTNKEIAQFCPANQNEWREWLEKNHETESSIWLIVYKKNSPTPNLSWGQAVDEALCFGWIDSVKKTIDDEKYKQFYSKRKPKSNWSKINKEKVARFEKQGLMSKAGLASVEIAKKNGSWTILDEVEELIIPKDLESELSAQKGALEYFQSLSKSKRKILLYWVMSAKRTETRDKRIKEITASASEGQMPKQF